MIISYLVNLNVKIVNMLKISSLIFVNLGHFMT